MIGSELGTTNDAGRSPAEIRHLQESDSALLRPAGDHEQPERHAEALLHEVWTDRELEAAALGYDEFREQAEIAGQPARFRAARDAAYMEGQVMPPRIARLPRDKRGYPIPWNIQRDANGLPLFTVNDDRKHYLAVRQGLCPICGETLGKWKWFIGGPRSAFHPDGA